METNKSYFSIEDKVLYILRSKVGIKDPGLLGRTDFRMLGFDILDIVDVINELEKVYKVNIPDEIALNTAQDLIDFLYSQSLQFE